MGGPDVADGLGVRAEAIGVKHDKQPRGIVVLALFAFVLVRRKARPNSPAPRDPTRRSRGDAEPVPEGRSRLVAGRSQDRPTVLLHHFIPGAPGAERLFLPPVLPCGAKVFSEDVRGLRSCRWRMLAPHAGPRRNHAAPPRDAQWDAGPPATAHSARRVTARRRLRRPTVLRHLP